MTKNSHILFLCGWYPSRVFPTNGDFIQRHAEAVATRHPVSVIHLVTDPTVTRTTTTIETHLGVRTCIAYIPSSKTPWTKAYRFAKAFFSLWKQIEKVDLVHLNILYPFGIIALFLNIRYRIPYLITEHWTGYHAPNSNKLSPLRKWLSKQISKRAGCICPVSDHLARSMQAIGYEGTYQSVPNVVNTELFQPSTEKEPLPTIVHISDMNDRHKNISGMIRVAKELYKKQPEVQWKCIGGSGAPYQKQGKTLELPSENFQFIEHLSHKELIKHLQKAHLFVLFSNYENLPCVILEAFACGVPVVASNVGGIREYFPSDFGELIPKNDEQALLKGIELQLLTAHDSEKMHTYAKVHFSKEAIALTFSNLYQHLLNKTN